MNLEHIGISINHKDDILSFYQDILKMELIRTFTLNSELANIIFSANQDVPVYLLKGGDLMLEAFLDTEEKPKGFNHICISIKNRELTVKNATNNGYVVIRKEREQYDLIFLCDKSGNIFEIKEAGL